MRSKLRFDTSRTFSCSKVGPKTKFENLKTIAIGLTILNFLAGNEWKTHRALVSPVFTTKKIKDIFMHFQKASKPLFTNIENLIKTGRQDEVDTKDLLRKYSLDVIAKFVFALELNSATDKDHPFVKTVAKLVNFDDRFLSFVMNLLPPALVNFIGRFYTFVDSEAMNYLADTTRYLIKQRKENSGQFNDFLDLLLDTMKEKNLELPEDEIIGNCMVSQILKTPFCGLILRLSLLSP